jgi:hypothetical protein
MGRSSVLYIKPTGFDITKGEIMAMSRKDYELIARCISNARYDKAGLAPEFQHGIDAVAMWLDIQLAAAYPNYDSQKFLPACQYGKLPRISEVA